jgi:hypothetical protein
MRDFSLTAEPSGKRPVAKAKALRFVIQKHAATRLHTISGWNQWHLSFLAVTRGLRSIRLTSVWRSRSRTIP